MSISGSLEDVSVADVMQFIHLGQRTGTLVLTRNHERALIGFHCGKLVSAYVPGRPKLGTLLVTSGLLDQAMLEDAIDSQSREAPHRSLGQILVARGHVDPERLREAVVQQIEGTVSEAVTWNSGTFEFVVDDLRPVDDIAIYPGDVIPDADINTQMVLLEAARIFDERNREETIPGLTLDKDDTQPMGARGGGQGGIEGRGSGSLPAAAAERVARAAALTLLEPELVEGVIEDVAGSPPLDHRRLWVDIVSGDSIFAHDLSQALPNEIPHFKQMALEEVGLAAPRDALPVAVIDLRDQSVSLSQVRALHHSRPRVAIIALLDSGASFGQAYAAGAKAVLPAETDSVVACMESLLEAHVPPSVASSRQGGKGGDPRGGVARLRRVFGDLRSGLISATVALNLMHIISESVERAVLFLVKREDLMALGAFGSGADGRPLAELTRGLTIPLSAENALTWSLEHGEARSMTFEEASLPEDFVELVGRPSNGQIVVFPVLGAQRVISIIYTDNGDHLEPIEDIEILELATAQVGMAFENELLRRQISQKN